MEILVKEYLTTLVRNLVMPVVAILAATGYVTENDAAQFGIAVAALLVAVVWGLANKYLWKQSAERALDTPPPPPTVTEEAKDSVLNKVISGTSKINIPWVKGM